jgi:signal peptidase II
MKTFPKILLSLFVLLACVGCDRITKNAAQAQLTPGEPISHLGGVVVFEYAENPGAMLGFGADLPPLARTWMLIGFNSLVLAAVLFFTLRHRHMTAFSVAAGALMVGGGIGNIIDRLINDGLVIDFVHIGVGSLRTGVFNVADVAILSGAGLLVFWSTRSTPEQEEGKELPIDSGENQ